MASPPSHRPQTYLTLQLLTQADRASLPEREGLFREVVLLNMDVAEAIARRHFRYRQRVEDVTTMAGAGLDKAARTFDPAREHNFWRHAKPAITDEVRRYQYPRSVFRQPPRHLEALALQIKAVVPELVDDLGHAARATDIAGRLQADLKDVIEVLTTDARVSRMD